MERRSLLIALGSAFGGGFVGYAVGAADSGGTTASASTSNAGDEQSIGAAATTPSETETPTANTTPTATPTPTATSTSTATPTVTPSPYPTHEFGESFAVSGPSTDFRYTFDRAFQAEAIGRFGGTSADGVYVGVVLTIENLTNSPTAVPLRSIVLQGGVRKYPSVNATNAGAHDDRVSAESLANTTLHPNRPVHGVIVYELDPTATDDLSVSVTPPDVDGPIPHIVPLGPISGLDVL
jgi:hypothetical protein